MPNTRNGVMNRVSKSARRAAAQAEQTAGQMTDRVREFADEALAGAQSHIAAAQEAAAPYVKQGREAVGSAGELLRAYVKAQPVKSLAIAAGIGLALSVLFRRR